MGEGGCGKAERSSLGGWGGFYGDMRFELNPKRKLKEKEREREQQGERGWVLGESRTYGGEGRTCAKSTGWEASGWRAGLDCIFPPCKRPSVSMIFHCLLRTMSSPVFFLFSTSSHPLSSILTPFHTNFQFHILTQVHILTLPASAF